MSLPVRSITFVARGDGREEVFRDDRLKAASTVYFNRRHQASVSGQIQEYSHRPENLLFGRRQRPPHRFIEVAHCEIMYRVQ